MAGPVGGGSAPALLTLSDFESSLPPSSLSLLPESPAQPSHGTKPHQPTLHAPTATRWSKERFFYSSSLVHDFCTHWKRRSIPTGMWFQCCQSVPSDKFSSISSNSVLAPNRLRVMCQKNPSHHRSGGTLVLETLAVLTHHRLIGLTFPVAESAWPAGRAQSCLERKKEKKRFP